MAALIHWLKPQFPNGIHRLGLFRPFLLVVRFTSLACLLALVAGAVVGVVLSLESVFNLGSILFFGGRVFGSRLRRSSSQTNVRTMGPLESFIARRPASFMLTPLSRVGMESSTTQTYFPSSSRRLSQCLFGLLTQTRHQGLVILERNDVQNQIAQVWMRRPE